MAQRTGTQILAHARVVAQDNDAAGNYAVSDTDALPLLNEVLMRWLGEGESRPTYLAASATGLTYAAGDSYKDVAASQDISVVLDAFQSASSSAAQPTGEPLRSALVDDIKAMLGAEDDGTFAASSSAQDFTHYAVEALGGTNTFRIYVYPRLARERSLTLKVSAETILSALSGTPPLRGVREAYIVARLLAFEMARLQKRPTDFLQTILSMVPPGALKTYFKGQQVKGQARVADAEDWG